MARMKSSGKVVPIYDREPLKPKTENQKAYMNMIRNHDLIVGIGPAGTGKTHIAACIAADMLEDPRSPIERIIIVRPPEGPGKTIGFLKGSLIDKTLPWAMPITEAIESRFGGGSYAKEKVKNMLDNGTIELLPLEYIRGRSLNNSFIICDEAENCTWNELKALTTRIGWDSKLVVCGDLEQKDILGESGLAVLLKLIDQWHTPFALSEFTDDDCVRSKTVKFLLGLYKEAGV